jgi:predicted TIM-barrel fold metal-dependent hydrolase
MPGSTRPTQFGRIYPPDEAWLARQPPEPVLDADLPIVDTHHHLWERPDHTMKLGGMMMRLAAYDYRTQPGPPSSAELATLWRPYIEPCIERFGANRCMFESNFPVEKMGTGWAALWNAFKRIAAGASHAEKLALFSGTARRAYRLD